MNAICVAIQTEQLQDADIGALAMFSERFKFPGGIAAGIRVQGKVCGSAYLPTGASVLAELDHSSGVKDEWANNPCASLGYRARRCHRESPDGDECCEETN